LTGKQAAPDGANICYGIPSCYKQIAPTELMGNTFFKRLNWYVCLNINLDQRQRNHGEVEHGIQIYTPSQR